jgi:hypothetical protein
MGGTTLVAQGCEYVFEQIRKTLKKIKIEITIIKPNFLKKLRPQGAISMEKLNHSPHM